MHTRENKVFFLNTLKISLAPTPQEGPFQVMLAGTEHTKEQKELNTRERKGPGCHENNVCSRRLIHPISLVSDADSDDNTDEDGEKNPNRNTIEEFTEEIDEAGFVGQCNFLHLPIRLLCLCLALMSFLLGVALPSPCLVTVAVSIPHCVVKSDRLSLDDDRLRED